VLGLMQQISTTKLYVTLPNPSQSPWVSEVFDLC